MKKIEWFNDGKNFGVIAYKENGDAFIYYTVSEYEYVELELVKTDEGYEAKKIVLPKEIKEVA